VTHSELTERAARWLKNTLNCRVVIRERVAACIETPDAAGWVNGYCILVECKTSRGDFLVDQKKSFRRNAHIGVGHWRFYLTAPGLLAGLDIPAGWGWYVVEGRSVKHAGGARYANADRPPFRESAQDGEIRLLLAEMVARELSGPGRRRARKAG